MENAKKLLASGSLIASPIGPIPLDFMRISELCKVAHIRYNDEEIDGLKIRTWRVIADDGKKEEGVRTTNFKKVCMLLDYLAYKNPTFTRNQILAHAIFGDAITKQSWQNMNDEMARMGVRGYDVLKRKKDKERFSRFDKFENLIDD